MNQRVANRTDALERMLGTLREKASRDPMTGLYNRRYMEDALERYLNMAERTDSATSVIMIDLDHFKTLNDEHGHAKGDAVLREVAGQSAGEDGGGALGTRTYYTTADGSFSVPDPSVVDPAQAPKQLQTQNLPAGGLAGRLEEARRIAGDRRQPPRRAAG